MEEYQSVKEWRTSLKADLSGSKDTEITYLTYLRLFCEWSKMNPDQLIEERKADLRGGNEDLEMRAEKRLQQFIVHMRDLGKSKSTIKTAASAVKSFYKRVYPRGKLVSALPLGPKKSSTKKKGKTEILRVLTGATPLQRAAILTIYQGMFRPVTLERMPAKVFLEAMKEEPPVNIHVEEDWNKGDEIAYDTFIDKDAVEAIKVLNRENGDGPLFGKADSIGSLISDAAKRVGEKEFNARVLRSSGASHMRTMGIPEAHVEEMQGHAQKYGGAYANFAVEELRESYKKADMNIYGRNEKVRISELNRTKREFAETIWGLAKAMQMSGNPSMLDAIVRLCEEAKELRVWNPLEESTPFMEVLKQTVKMG